MFKPGDRIVSVSDNGTDIDIGEEFTVIRCCDNRVWFLDRDGYQRTRFASQYQLAEVYHVMRLLREYEV